MSSIVLFCVLKCDFVKEQYVNISKENVCAFKKLI